VAVSRKHHLQQVAQKLLIVGYQNRGHGQPPV